MDEEVSKGKITRRDFLKVAAIAGAAFVGRKLLGESLVFPENPKPTILVLDIFENDSLIRAEVDETKKSLIQQTADYFGDHGTNVDQVRKKAFEEFNPGQVDMSLKDSITGAVNFGEVTYDYLGNPSMVMKVDDKVIVAKIAGSPSRIVSMSFEMGRMEVKRDENYLYKESTGSINRVGGSSYISSSKIDENGNEIRTERFFDLEGREITKEKYEELEKVRSERKVKTHEPEDVKFIFKDAYSGVDTYDNLAKLTRLAGKFPEKFFIAAGGNPYNIEGDWVYPDIRNAREKLTSEGLWPDNLIIVGVQGLYGNPGGDDLVKLSLTYGADIYVKSKDLYGEKDASSFATPIISEVVRKIIVLGVTDVEKIREILNSVTDEEGEENKLRVFNKEKFKSYISGSGK